MNVITTIFTENDYKQAISRWLLSDATSLTMFFKNRFENGFVECPDELPVVAIRVPDCRFPDIDDILLLTPDEPMYDMEEYGFWDKKKKQFLLCVSSSWALPEIIYHVYPFEAKTFDQVQDELQKVLGIKLLQEMPQEKLDFTDCENTEIKYITKFPSCKTAMDVEHVVRYWKGEKESVLNQLSDGFRQGKLTVHGIFERDAYAKED